MKYFREAFTWSAPTGSARYAGRVTTAVRLHP
jgi:hypothetical protein